MSRYAVMDGNVVANVILWDGVSEIEGSENFILCDGVSISPGWIREGDSWVDPSPFEPTLPEVDPEYLRQLAYQAEADPLYFKWQRGEASEQEWLDKVQEIRDRYPDE